MFIYSVTTLQLFSYFYPEEPQTLSQNVYVECEQK